MYDETSKTKQTESNEEAATNDDATVVTPETESGKDSDNPTETAAVIPAATTVETKTEAITETAVGVGTENTDDATEEADDEDIPLDPLDERVFGMPRMCFHGAAFGVAGGYIVSGLIGLVADKTPSATTCAIVCAAVGYLLTKQQHKKLLAKRDAEKQE